ncbi:hypothetical protein E2320_018969 [Naja naja]|nr:hypothetical protein E2320_018969 [Naja naja]
MRRARGTRLRSGELLERLISGFNFWKKSSFDWTPDRYNGSKQQFTTLCSGLSIPTGLLKEYLSAMTPGIPIFSPMMPYGTGLTPQPAQSTNSLSILEEQQRQQQQQAAAQQNIVSTVNLGCKLDLKTIALRARNAEYNPKRFAAVIMRIREPRTTALIFSSGKMVCTGAKSEEQSRLAARKYARVVQKLGFPAKFLDFKIQNMVGSCDVKFPIRLEGLVLTHQQFSSYEPELFPGLIYRMIKPRIVLLIFVSGKVVLTVSDDQGMGYCQRASYGIQIKTPTALPAEQKLF